MEKVSWAEVARAIGLHNVQMFPLETLGGFNTTRTAALATVKTSSAGVPSKLI